MPFLHLICPVADVVTEFKKLHFQSSHQLPVSYNCHTTVILSQYVLVIIDFYLKGE